MDKNCHLQSLMSKFNKAVSSIYGNTWCVGLANHTVIFSLLTKPTVTMHISIKQLAGSVRVIVASTPMFLALQQEFRIGHFLQIHGDFCCHRGY